MAKKKKGKKGKKKSVSESEILLNIINNLNCKIEWRKEQCENIKNDIEYYQNICKEEYENSITAIGLLEKAVQDAADRYQKIQLAIPEANDLLLKAEEDNYCSLANDLVKLDEETKKNDEQLLDLRKLFVELETYNVQSIEENILKIEKELDSANQRDLRPGIDFDNSLKMILQNEMQHIFETKIAEYQDELSSNVNHNLMRIAEETRWWENSGYILLNKKTSLEQKNSSKMADIKKLKQDIEFHSKNCLQDSKLLHNLTKKVTLMKNHLMQLQQTQIEIIEFKNKSNEMDVLIENYTNKTDNQKRNLEKIVANQEVNEALIKTLEMELMSEAKYGGIISNIIQKILKLITEEVNNSLLKNSTEFTEKKNILLELDKILMEATKFFYEPKSY